VFARLSDPPHGSGRWRWHRWSRSDKSPSKTRSSHI
jgi:hypothetical protein